MSSRNNQQDNRKSMEPRVPSQTKKAKLLNYGKVDTSKQLKNLQGQKARMIVEREQQKIPTI